MGAAGADSQRAPLASLSGPQPPTPAPGSQPPAVEFAWLLEVREEGEFLGYLRLEGTFDPISGKLLYRVPVALLEGTLFLPVVLQPARVANHDPDAHIWSDPLKGATNFGVAAPQWTVFPVVAPQVGQRLLVYNPFTDNYGWLDVAGVGPAAREE